MLTLILTISYIQLAVKLDAVNFTVWLSLSRRNLYYLCTIKPCKTNLKGIFFFQEDARQAAKDEEERMQVIMEVCVVWLTN